MRWVQVLKMLVLTAVGCTNNDTQNVQPGGDSEEEDDPDLPELCTEAPESFASVSAELTDMPTVARATWETVTPSVEASVTFWVDGEEAQSTPTTTSGTVLLLGLHQNQTYHWQVSASLEGGEVVCSEEQTLETGEFEYELPNVVLDIDQAEASDGYIVTEMILAEESFLDSYVVIIDGEGKYVWATQLEENLAWRARLSRDRQSVLVFSPAGANGGNGFLTRVSLDGSVETRVEKQGIYVDFVELPNGQLATFVRQLTEEDGRSYIGSQIVEMEPDGSESVVVWDSFEAWEIEPSDLPDICNSNEICDYAHLNFLHYEEGDDSYYATALYRPAVARIDRNGNESWTLQNEGKGDFPEAPVDLVAYPHSAYPMDDEGEDILLFNQHVYDGGCSEVSLIGIDEEEGRAWEEWTYPTEECPNVYVLGEAIPIENGNGNILVVFSTEGRIDQASSTGETLWRVSTEEDWFGYSEFVPSLYKE